MFGIQDVYTYTWYIISNYDNTLMMCTDCVQVCVELPYLSEGICGVILPDGFEKLSLHPNNESCYTKSHHHVTLCCTVIYVYMRMALACYLQM